jgi:hypothetical protein
MTVCRAWLRPDWPGDVRPWRFCSVGRTIAVTEENSMADISSRAEPRELASTSCLLLLASEHCGFGPGRTGPPVDEEVSDRTRSPAPVQGPVDAARRQVTTESWVRGEQVPRAPDDLGCLRSPATSEQEDWP